MIASLVFLIAVGCQKHADHSSSGSDTEQGSSSNALLRRVSAKQVCMANDRYMGEDQIPVTVQGRTYFGCCPGCEQRLNREADLRTAKDPVSGRSVDKSSAVIGKLRSGRVLYFENDSTFAKYGAADRPRRAHF